MQVVWTPEAKQQLRNAVIYGVTTFGERVTARFVSEIEKNNERLASFPRAGKIELQLRDCEREYRCLVVRKRYKMIYFIEEETVFIVALWDTRCNPSRMKTEIE